MAHPLTQQPPSAIPFGSASRPSPLAFGFGQPSSSSSSSNQSFPSGGNVNLGFGFGLKGSGQSSPSKRAFNTPRPTISTPAQSSLKRSRRSSNSSSSASPPPTPSHPYSRPRLASGKDKEGDLLADVGGLAMKDDGRRIASGKLAKRAKPDGEENKIAADDSGVDLGVLLAALPSTAHLSILLRVLQTNPTLVPSVLSQMPQPDLGECLRTLDKSLQKINKFAGGPLSDGPDSQAGRRLWMRIEGDVGQYCVSASTYLNFLTSTNSRTTENADIQSLLYAITSGIYRLLSLIPSSTSHSTVHPASAKPVMDLANLVLSKWTEWTTALSTEVNQRGGMYPHSVVNSWVEGMDELVNWAPSPISSIFPQSRSAWNTPTSPFSWTLSQSNAQQSTSPPDHPLVLSFKEAFLPIRECFIAELGWLVGRHPQPSSQISHQRVQPAPSSSYHTGNVMGMAEPNGSRGIWGGGISISAGGRSDDEEL